MNIINERMLGKRLSAVASQVRDGAVFCDVGTDHAKLPIYLATHNRISMGYATDINAGPIDTARKNVSSFGLSSVIECIQTDGLDGMSGLGITDVSICGMGGELIARILSDCDFVRDKSIKLILQPMSHTPDLRRFLYDNGFFISNERFVYENDKLYVIFTATYTGGLIKYDEIDMLIGYGYKSKLADAAFGDYVDRTLFHLKNKFNSTDKSESEKAKFLYKKIIEVTK